MKYWTIAAAFLLAACDRTPVESRAARAAEQRYALVSKHGTVGEQCAAAGEVRDAWLKAQDEERYRNAERRAKADCDITIEEAGLPADPAEQLNVVNEEANAAVADAGAALNAAGAAVANGG